MFLFFSKGSQKRMRHFENLVSFFQKAKYFTHIKMLMKREGGVGRGVLLVSVHLYVYLVVEDGEEDDWDYSSCREWMENLKNQILSDRSNK